MANRGINWKEIVVNSLYRRDQGKCQLCAEEIGGSHLFEIDHIIEKADGGFDTIDNLRLVHIACHKARHINDRTIINPELVKAVKLAFISPPFEFTRQSLREYSDKKILVALKAAYEEAGSFQGAAKMCGMTQDQLRYFRKKHCLPKNTIDWHI